MKLNCIIVGALFFASSLNAHWVSIDHFEDGNTDGWNVDSTYFGAPPTVEGSLSVVEDPFGQGQGLVMKLDPGQFSDDTHRITANYPLGNLAITNPSPDSNKATLYFKVGRPSAGGLPGEVDVTWGLAASTSPDAFAYSSYSVLGRYSASGMMDLYDGNNGGYTPVAPSPLETQTYYEVWLVVDHAVNTVSQYIRGGNDFPVQTLVYSGATYRSITLDDLDNILLKSTTGTPWDPKGKDPLYFDEFTIDLSGENLSSPGDWAEIDNFDDGVQSWTTDAFDPNTATFATQPSQTTIDNPFGSGKVMLFDQGVGADAPYNYIASWELTENQQIQGPGTQTLHFRVGFTDTADNVDLVWAASDVPFLPDRYGSMAVGGRIVGDGSGPVVMEVRDGGAGGGYKPFHFGLSNELQANKLYDVWLVIDHESNTFDQFIQGGSYAEPTLVYAGAHYRRETSDNLDNFSFASSSGGGGLLDFAEYYIDDVEYLYDWAEIPNYDFVDIPDANLSAAIREALGIVEVRPILVSEIQTLTELNAWGAGIADLTGLEAATNLTFLQLGQNAFSDLSPLSGLTSLNFLYLSNNGLSDVSALSGLSGLNALGLINNNISDASALSGLTNLSALQLSSNALDDSDLSDLSGLTSLNALLLSNNAITNVDLLSGLTNLENLQLSNNAITSVSPLSGLTALTSLNLGNNQITDLETLVNFTNLETLFLQNNGISDLSPITGLTALTFLNLSNNQITDLGPLTTLANLERLFLSGNPITDLTPIAGLSNLQILSVRNTWLAVYEGSTQKAILDTLGISPNFYDLTVNIPDANLLAAIQTSLSIPEERPVVRESEIQTLTELNAWGAGIADLTGLEAATNLTFLQLGQNAFSDLSPLSGLTSLNFLYLSNNGLSDVSALSGLSGLNTLGLINNNISDASALSGLTNLSELQLSSNALDDSDLSDLSGLTSLNALLLSNNAITNVDLLSGLTNLENLQLSNNAITSVSPLSGLTALRILNLDNNQITDLSPIATLTSLERLFAQNNGISDLSPITGLTTLTFLRLGNNQIADLNPIGNLTNLENLFLQNNEFTDLSPIAGLTALTFLTLNNNQITDLGPLATLTNLERLFLFGNPITDLTPIAGLSNLQTLSIGNTWLAIYEGSTQKAILDALNIPNLFYNLTVNIPDANLFAAVQSALSIPEERPVVRESEIQTLVTLVASDRGIADLTGLETATSITTLQLGMNAIYDVSPLSGLTTLDFLQLDNNQITDASPLGNLNNLTYLDIEDNALTAFSWLSNLSLLTDLNLAGTGIANADLSFLGSLPGLLAIDLGGNSLGNTDLVTLASLPNLQANLTELRLNNNGIDDASPLASLPALTLVTMSDNLISSLTPFSSLSSLGTLNVAGNALTDIGPLLSIAPDSAGVLSSVNITFNEIDFTEGGIQESNLAALLLAGVDVNSYPQITEELTGITEVGEDVVVSPQPVNENGDPVADAPLVTMDFEEIDGIGNTTITTTETAPEIPEGFQLSGTSTFLDIETTADFEGTIVVCLDYSELTLNIAPSELRLYHYDEELEAWEDITVSNNTEAMIICGETDSLSPFAIVSVNPVGSLDELADAVMALNVKKGIVNSYDAKLANVRQALDDANDTNNVSAVNALGAFINAVEAQRGKELSDTEANELIEQARVIRDKLTI